MGEVSPKSEYQKMLDGEQYCFSDPEILEHMQRSARLMRELSLCGPDDYDRWHRAVHALLPNAHDTAMVMPPFHCDHGDRISLGYDTFVNYNCTFLDSGGIELGDHCKVGPDCHFYTPQHPMDYLERRQPVERSLGIKVGDDCWFGGGCTVCPGVTIGNRVIIAAGSVVVHDVPDDVLIAGNPAVVKRKLR